MLLKHSKKLLSKGIEITMKAIPVIVPVLLVIHTNSTASSFNGQPKLPASITKYRKF